METTGLNPRLDEILEVALVVTGNNVVECTAISFVVDPGDVKWEDRLDDEKAMHIRSGLLRDVVTVGLLLPAVEDALLTTLKRVDKGPFVLCGINPVLNRAFIESRMRRFNRQLDYRSIDVLSIRRFLRDLCERDELMPPFADADSKTHRAMDDLQDVISEARIYRTYIEQVPEFLC